MLGLSEPPSTATAGQDAPRRTRRRLFLAAALIVMAVGSGTVTWIHEHRAAARFLQATMGAGHMGYYVRTTPPSTPRAARTVDTKLSFEVVPQPEGTPAIVRLTREDRPGCVIVLRSDDIARRLDPRASTVTAEIVDYQMDGRRPLYEIRRLGPITDTTDLSRADAAGCRPW